MLNHLQFYVFSLGHWACSVLLLMLLFFVVAAATVVAVVVC